MVFFSLLMALPLIVITWKEGYLYRRKILVTNNKDFEVVDSNFSIVINTKSLMDDGLLLASCIDSVFTLEDGSFLRFWLESGCGENSTSFWVTLPHIHASESLNLYLYTGKSDQSVSDSLEWNGNFAFLSNTTCNNEYFAVFPEENIFLKGFSYQNFNVSGSLDHEHKIPPMNTTVGSEPAINEGNDLGEEVAWVGHKHEVRFTDLVNGVASNEYEYQNLPLSLLYFLCVGNDSVLISPLSIPSNVLVFFDDETEALDSGWDEEEQLNEHEFYPIIASIPDDVLSLIGRENHTHIYNDSNWECTNVINPGDLLTDPPYCENSGSNDEGIWLDHFHPSVESKLSEAQNDPRHLFLNARSTPSTTDNNKILPVKGMITPLFCSSILCPIPPIGYERYTNLDGCFLRATSNFLLVGTTGGSSNHTHEISGNCTESSDSINCEPFIFIGDYDLSFHTHAFSGATEPPSTETVPYGQFVFVKRLGESPHLDVNLDLSLDESETFLTCFGVYAGNKTSVICSGHGICTDINVCNCTSGYYSDECDIWSCSGTEMNVTKYVCSGHGNCIAPEKCECEENYYGDICEVTTCNGIFSNDSELVCWNHGSCISLDNCSCYSNYIGIFCDFWTCGGISKTQVESCTENGLCMDIDSCSCYPGYSSIEVGGDCTEWYCFDVDTNEQINKDDENVCSKRGECIEPMVCACKDDYEGLSCDTWSCGADYKFKDATCSGHGKCVGPMECECDYGFGGQLCTENKIYANVIAPVASVIGVTVISIICILMCCIVAVCSLVCYLIWFCGMILFCSSSAVFLLRKRVYKFKKLKNFDLLLQEQELEEDDTIAHLKFRKELFRINMDDVRNIAILGQGGSQSTVYKSEWSGKIVAFKCFKTRTVVSNQDTFDEFEKEVELLSSLSHPNIIRFFGACLNPPRVGIVMEFCSKGELLEFILKFRVVRGTGYPLTQKLRMLTEVASALEFLHSKNVIHRDLKSENVLISEDEATKLMDFGLSKMVERVSQVKTKRIGTSDYMAPEIVSSTDYNEKVDVFSFSILLFVVLSELIRPYSDPSKEDEYFTSVELKVANDRNFRPNIDKNLKPRLEKENLMWLSELMVKCWDHDPIERYSIKEVREILQKRGGSSFSKEVQSLEKIKRKNEEEEGRVKKEEEEERENNNMFLSKEKFQIDENISFEDLKRKFKEMRNEMNEMRKENTILRMQLRDAIKQK